MSALAWVVASEEVLDVMLVEVSDGALGGLLAAGSVLMSVAGLGMELGE